MKPSTGRMRGTFRCTQYSVGTKSSKLIAIVSIARMNESRMVVQNWWSCTISEYAAAVQHLFVWSLCRLNNSVATSGIRK